MSTLQQLTRDLKQSPGRAVVLFAGVVVAGFVWAPRLKHAFGAGAGGGSKSPSVTLDPAGEPVATESPVDSARSASEIRDEFKQIVAYADELHRRATEPMPRDDTRDPFFLDSSIVDPIDDRALEPVPVDTTPQTSPAEEERDRAEQIRLTGVMVFPNRRSAVLDGTLVQEGDTHDGFRVTSVASRAVTLRGEYAEYRVAMRGGLTGDDDEEDNP